MEKVQNETYYDFIIDPHITNDIFHLAVGICLIIGAIIGGISNFVNLLTVFVINPKIRSINNAFICSMMTSDFCLNLLSLLIASYFIFDNFPKYQPIICPTQSIIFTTTVSKALRIYS